MLYYVKDPEATINFFQSLLDKDGKLLIILVSGKWLELILNLVIALMWCVYTMLCKSLGSLRNVLVFHENACFQLNYNRF